MSHMFTRPGRSAAVAVLAGAALTVVGGAGAAHADGDQHGAIAYSDSSGTVAAAANYSDAPSADSAAIAHCGGGDCRVILDFSNGCGSVAQGADGKIAVGWGPTKTESEKQAIEFLGPSAPPFPDLGSASPRPATIALTSCTANAR
ncbi:DUF4189 domain-containing protein [Nocardia vermiculata]|uniref:DUF4189 domain-containing protein n=1 Tax=Nocardia vermiculata TaxID=257274 RepID=A0A846Y279_9NOCA|nr:DUF4189 domain-containing protein [Nocardia vermiculata]NKY51368.1 DUF4189 domain-containing protein [Nocardia vermiculata]